MKDRFKFRVWSKANNKYCHHITTDLSADGLLRVLRPLEKSEYIDDWEHQYDIQQCTGLKDKNGKLIYEGDVVTYDWLTPISKVWRTDGKHIVEWQDGFTVIGNIAGYDVKHGKSRNVEVIGNIYENPELLEDNQ